MVDRVGESTLEAAQGLGAGLAFGSLLLHIDLGFGIPRCLGSRDYVDGAVDAAVASSIEAVTIGASGGDGDRSSAIAGSEVVLGGEASDVADFANDPSGGDGTHAVEVGKGGSNVGNRLLDLGRQLSNLVVKTSQSNDATARYRRAGTLEALSSLAALVTESGWTRLRSWLE